MTQSAGSAPTTALPMVRSRHGSRQPVTGAEHRGVPRDRWLFLIVLLVALLVVRRNRYRPHLL